MEGERQRTCAKGTAYTDTAKPVCNDHLYDEIYHLWFIQKCVSIMTEGTNLLLLTIGHLDELQNAKKYPIRWSL